MKALSALRALMVALGLVASAAHAEVTAEIATSSGDLCDPGTGPSFETCELNGSPTIMKLEFAIVNGYGLADVEVNTTAFPELTDIWLTGVSLADLDTGEDYRFEANGFTLWLESGLRSGSWSYDENGPYVTYFTVKYGNLFETAGSGSPIRESTFSLDQAFSHITFYDSYDGGDEPGNGVPLPGTVGLLGLGLIGLAAGRRRRA